MSEPDSIIVLGSSPIHGIGCFASRNIAIGTFITEYRGELIDEAEARRRDDPKSTNYSQYVMHLSDDNFIDGAIGGDKERYLNHSCQPNCRVERLDRRILLVAAKDITVFDELTIDYALEYGSAFKCRCNAATCRGTPLDPNGVEP